jgi:hypothetical protein
MSIPTAPSLSNVGAHIDVHVGIVHDNVIEDWRAGLQRNVERKKAEIARLAFSNDYTPLGRDKAVRAARERAREVLKPQEEIVERYRARIADIETRAIPPRQKRTANDLPDLLIEQEIRQRVKGQDALQLLPMYLSAIERGDDQFCRALEEAPAAFPLLTAEMLEQGRGVKLAKCPDAELLAQLREELDIHTAVLQAAARDLATAGDAVVPPDRA